LKFSKIHLFRYSPREGTEAAALPNPVSPQIQRQRAEHLSVLAHELRCEFAKTLCGQTLSVLLENENGGTADRYLEVRLTHPVEASQIGQLVNVRSAESQEEILVGDVMV
jgi:threonylcarbamoyladenosine tRNA methylthiotransferase MtaB